MNEEEAVLAEGVSKNFIQFEKGNKTSALLQTAYQGVALPAGAPVGAPARDFASSAVGTKTGAQASIQAGQAGAASVADAGTVATLDAAASRGESSDDDAFKVTIKDFEPEAQKKLRESYGKMLAGHNALGKIESQEFLGEAGDKADKTASIAKMIGDDGAAKKLASLADHSSMTFDEALAESGVDISQLDPATQKAIQDTFENIRKSKDQMVEESYKTSEKEIEDELDGIKMVMGANNNGIRFGRMKSELNKAKELYKTGNLTGAQSIIQGVSPTLDVNGKDGVEGALKKRMDHLNQGVAHFENFYKAFENISDPDARRSAIAVEQKKMLVNPTSYINEVGERKKAEARVDAEAKTAVHIASSNLAANPTIQNLPVAQLATNPAVMEEFTRAVTGLTDSLDAYGEQVEHLASQTSQGGGLSQVGSVAPIDMGVKSMITGALNTALGEGTAKMGDTIQKALSNEAFRKTLTKGVKSALDESKAMKKAMAPTKTPPPVQTTPPTESFKMPPE
jgi:hypothetical protein